MLNRACPTIKLPYILLERVWVQHVWCLFYNRCMKPRTIEEWRQSNIYFFNLTLFCDIVKKWIPNTLITMLWTRVPVWRGLEYVYIINTAHVLYTFNMSVVLWAATSQVVAQSCRFTAVDPLDYGSIWVTGSIRAVVFGWRTLHAVVNMDDPLDWPHIDNGMQCSSPKHYRPYAARHPNTTVNREWIVMSRKYVIKICKNFRRRFEGIIASDGGYIE